ncbi:MAG: peptidylprolyl isomerase, partial [Calditrichota bacterium]
MHQRQTPLWVFLAVGITALVMMSCSQRTVSDSDVVATWGDTTITVADFKDRMFIRHRNEATAEKQTMKERLSIFLEYTERDLKLADARRLGFDKREDVQKQYRDAIERFAVDLLYKDKVRAKSISEDMLKDFYKYDEYEVRARHILISVPEEAKGKDTMQFFDKINEIYQKAQSGENFISLVDRYSEDESMDRSLHGDLGFFNWGKMVDNFQEAAWNLKPGEISSPVRTRYGWHIIQLIEKRPSGLEVRTSQIEVKCTRRVAPAETTAAFERAKMILDEAKKPGADFAQLARRYSEDDKTWVNGDVGWLPRGSMPTEYWDLALNMDVGQVGGPVRTYRGYHVIKVTDKRVTWKPLSDQEQQDRIYSRLEHLYRDTLKTIADAFLDSVKASVHSRYNDAAVNMVLTKLSDKSAPQNMNLFS